MPTNVEIVQDIFAAFQRGDIPSVLNGMDDNVEWVEPGAPVIPWAGAGKGNRAAEFFRVMGETTEMLKFEPQHYVASGDRVVGVVSWEIRVKATGKSAHTDLALDFTLQNGKVTRFQAYFDTAALQAAYTSR
jgi:ketosteroid isomerase-like protein